MSMTTADYKISFERVNDYGHRCIFDEVDGFILQIPFRLMPVIKRRFFNVIDIHAFQERNKVALASLFVVESSLNQWL